jgi:uncharacterized protein
VSRMPALNHITWTDIDKLGIPEDTAAVVNLAGQNVLDPSRRWTVGFKQNVFNSRVNTAKSLVRAIEKAVVKPEVFINISGVSNYKPDDKKVYTEEDPSEDYDFLSNLCIEWEKAATIAKETGVRNVKIRTGVVLGREGGMIQSLFLPFFMGVGGPVASGNQPLPWIYIDDLCNLIKHSIQSRRRSQRSRSTNHHQPRLLQRFRKSSLASGNFPSSRIRRQVSFLRRTSCSAHHRR